MFVSLPVAAQETGSLTCAGCHPAIVRQYSQSGMARTSGRIGAANLMESFEQAAFRDPSTGAQYRVSSGGESYRLEFERGPDVRGDRQLAWFLGSGRVGRSYVFSLDNYLYQSPVSYYSGARKWAISPGFQRRTSIDLTRAIEPSCLQCHATGLRPVAGTDNRFEDVPFAQDGIGCERCHGPGAEHASRMRNRKSGDASGETAIVNPAKLAPDERDSVCAQCHFTGAARVARAAAKSARYRPGDRLSRTVSIFLWSDARSREVEVTSHFEKLLYSRCREMSGTKLWCGSCHDPHGEPPAVRKVEYYRERCFGCHDRRACAETPAARQKANDNCVACHMPKTEVFEAEHTVYTDHAIPRVPSTRPAADRAPRRLVPYWPDDTDSSDSALAHAVAAVGEASIRREAFELLRKAEAANPGDMAIAAQLAQFFDRMRQPASALRLLERVSLYNPENSAAATNLGALYAQQGRLEEANELWISALKRNPGQSGARLNLAVSLLKSGERDRAIQEIRILLYYDPDNGIARQLLGEALK